MEDSIHIVKIMLDEGACRPLRAHRLDAGLDLMCRERVTVPARNSVLIDTGVHVSIEPGWFGKLESRSGLMVNHGVFCPGGVIDSGYTGSIVVMLHNLSDEDYEMEQGDKCAQLVICPCAIPLMQVVPSMEQTDRGDGGFGSTGR